MALTSIKNDGNGGSPLAELIRTLKRFRPSAPVREFDSVNRLARRALDVGSQGNVNAYKSLGLFVG